VKKVLRVTVDIAMLLLLPVLMTEMLMGQQPHEWVGTVSFAVFVLHHIINYRWWGTLTRGDYTPVRCLMTVIDLLLVADILSLMTSGIMMSGFVFDWLNIRGGMMIARKLHLFASYWSLILMSAHVGLHAGIVAKRIKGSAAKWLVRILTLGVSVYGVYAFVAQKIANYLFLTTHFVLYDETKPVAVFVLETVAMIVLFAAVFYYLQKLLSRIKCGEAAKKALKPAAILLPVLVCLTVGLCLNTSGESENKPSWGGEIMSEQNAQTEAAQPSEPKSSAPQTAEPVTVSDGFLLIHGGAFQMGSPADEAWRVEDETQHTVTVSDFYISPYEVTQKEFLEIMGLNPSSFSGDELPVESVSWLDAVAFCNAKSVKEGLSPVYVIDGTSVSWDRAANGYRLPTEAEWEYACRAGTATPFNTENSPGADVCNFYGHYPYQIEENYFSQGNLDTKPGEYRQTTVDVDSFSPNKWGLYNMHGNVSEWVWDLYGAYSAEEQTDPTGAASGTLRVYRGGGWNDFAKNMRSAYRATLAQDKGSFNLGIRLVRNAAAGTGIVSGEEQAQNTENGGKVLIAFFSWGGNTRGIAEEIQRQTSADLFEIELVDPYSTSYNTVLEQAQYDQNIQARPEIKNKIESFEQYDTIILGYPNWWASIPMPIASLLEEYDFSGKTIIPFCSHGGGRFGQSLTAINKLAPDATMGEALSVHYSGGSSLESDIAAWLKTNGITY